MKTATGLILWYMKRCGFYAWTSSWKTLYALPGYENHPLLLKHEQVHLMQMERDGWLVFHIKTIWYFFRYGYQNSPYEIEARSISGI